MYIYYYTIIVREIYKNSLKIEKTYKFLRVKKFKFANTPKILGVFGKIKL